LQYLNEFFLKCF